MVVMEASIQNRSGSGDGNLSPDDSKFGAAAGEALETARKKILLDEKRVELGPDEIGGRPRHRDWAMQVDPAARLVWPVLPFNPYGNAPETDLRYAVGVLPAPVQPTAVDVADSVWRNGDSCRGVADRSALLQRGACRCARNCSASVLVQMSAPGLRSGALASRVEPTEYTEHMLQCA